MERLKKSWIESLSPRQRKSLTENLTDDEVAALMYEWDRWVHPSQRLPEGSWDGWLILAGRGWGKTRVGAETVRAEVESGRSKRIGLIGETSADGRGVMIHGESGIMECSPPWFKPTFLATSSITGRPQLSWPNGAIATLYDAREPDQLRGPQHDFIWFDELAKFRYPDGMEGVFDQAMMGLRLGDDPRWIATTTPRPIPLIKRLINQKGVVTTYGKSDENLINISQKFRSNVIDRYRGTRMGRQELDAEILEDVPGALWSRRGLDEGRHNGIVPPLVRIVVSVDPATTSGEDANETGIIVSGVDAKKHGYILEDWSMRGSPDQWGRKVVAAFRKYEADLVIAESNQGGEMVRMVIKTVADIPVKLVHASRGKYVRAEPIAALYEQDRVHHAGILPELEDQMIVFTPEAAAERKPGDHFDRVDALVWGLTELFPTLAPRLSRDPDPLPGFSNPVPSMGMLG